MTISGYSYIRNGFQYACPFLQSIQSMLPMCDEFVIAVGDSTDGIRTTGDWAFHIQADEVIHEQDNTAIIQAVRDADANH